MKDAGNVKVNEIYEACFPEGITKLSPDASR